MRSIRPIIAALLISAGIVAAAGNASADGSPLTVYVSPTHPMKNEKVVFSGDLPTTVVRPIKIQYRSGDRWRTLKAGTTEAPFGGYGLSAALTKSRHVRYYAPRATVGGRHYKAIVGRTRYVKLSPQSIDAFATPYRQCAFGAQPVTVVATFSPARPGRQVTVTVPGGSPVVTKQDDHGHVAVTFAPPSAAGTYTSVITTSSYSGAAAKSTSVKLLLVDESYCFV